MKLPIVCLVGRTNVGKSALFNRFTKRDVKSLVFDKEHVTRDYIETVIEKKGSKFLLVDTGGLFFSKNKNHLDNLAQAKALEMVEASKIALFVCDVKVGLQIEDERIIKLLRKMNKDIILLINKVDNDLLEFEINAFSKLGISRIFLTSAVHRKGIDEVMKFLVEKFKSPEQAFVFEDEDDFANDIKVEQDLNQVVEPVVQNSENIIENKSMDSNEVIFKVSIIGKPNVGKSSLLNLICQKERSIVSEIEGTTREAVSSLIGYNHQIIELVDTPGVRRQSSVNDSLEKMMVKTALASVRTSDIICIIIDGSKGELCNQELKLLDYSITNRKAVLLVINKIDLMDEEKKAWLEDEFKNYDFMLKKCLIVKVSCLDKKGISKVRVHLNSLWKKTQMIFDTAEVTQMVREYLTNRPLFKQRQELKIFKVKYIKASVPTFLIIVRNPKLFAPAELSCIENIIRKKFDLRGCPLVLRPVPGG